MKKVGSQWSAKTHQKVLEASCHFQERIEPRSSSQVFRTLCGVSFEDEAQMLTKLVDLASTIFYKGIAPPRRGLELYGNSLVFALLSPTKLAFPCGRGLAS